MCFMRNRLLFIIGITTLLACGNVEKKEMPGWDVTVSGKVGFPKEGNISIKKWTDTTEHAIILDFNRDRYTYQSNVRIEEPGYYRINFFDAQFVDVILDKSNLEVNVDGNAQNGFYEINGSPDVEIFKTIQAIRSGFQGSVELSKLNDDFNKAVEAKDEKGIQALQYQYQQLLKKPNDSIANLLVQKSPSVAVIEFLSKRELDTDQYFPVYEKVAGILKDKWGEYQVAREFIYIVEQLKTVTIGSVAPEISLPDPEGKIVSLSSFRGKYVLVDFWAKWCGPCRRENPNVVKVYKKFKDKGFEVFGVSLDRTKNDWLQAIAEDDLAWTHVSDLQYFNSAAAKTYGINAIPFSILLDPNGVIIAKNLRGNALEAKLEEIF